MKLYVPEIGDHLQLTADWTFDLYNEYRNSSLWSLYECDQHPLVRKQQADRDRIQSEINTLEAKMYPRGRYWNHQDVDPADFQKRNDLYDQTRKLFVTQVTIPKESVLAIDRIFIRKGMDDWSSLTFFLKHHPDKEFKKKPRFWAKLHDCNNIEFVQHNS